MIKRIDIHISLCPTNNFLPLCLWYYDIYMTFFIFPVTQTLLFLIHLPNVCVAEI